MGISYFGIFLIYKSQQLGMLVTNIRQFLDAKAFPVLFCPESKEFCFYYVSIFKNNLKIWRHS